MKNQSKIDPESTKIGLGAPWSRLGDPPSRLGGVLGAD